MQFKFRPKDDSLYSPEGTTCKMVVVIFIILFALSYRKNAYNIRLSYVPCCIRILKIVFFCNYTQPILVILIVLTTFIVAILLSFLITTTTSNGTTILQQPSDNKIEDARGDTNILALQKTNIVPEVRDYHDILSADVNKVNNKIQLTIDLAGDANQNKGYETVYLWLIYYTAEDEASTVGKEDLLYAVIIPNFGIGSNFGNIKKGWYLAIFNHTDNSYSIPLSRISDMPKNKVQVFFEADFIGNPSSSFNYIVSAMIRVNSTFLDKPPDYLVDSAPDNYNSFWKQWFR